MDKIEIRGARTHNLKNIDLTLTRYTQKANDVTLSLCLPMPVSSFP